MGSFEADHCDHGWSSYGLAPAEALRSWQRWACKVLAPMQIEIADEKRFAAHWRSHRLGPLHMVTLEASPQRVVHIGNRRFSPQDGQFQLLYCRRTPIAAQVGAEKFRLEVGECALVDNAQFYEMSMDGDHQAIDLIIPRSWLERWLPDPLSAVGRPFSASANWGLPLGTFLLTMAGDLENAALPRPVLADQVGPLLALAVGHEVPFPSRHKRKILQRVLWQIEERYSDPDLDPGRVATALGISKRHLHAVLAEAGLTFLGTLGRVRLDRACELLTDRRFAHRKIVEIAWQCGYLDPSYFARVFRRKFTVGPREWRNARLR